MIKQYIILRKDAPTITGNPVSPQKLGIMTAHASMVFLSRQVTANSDEAGHVDFTLDKESHDWLMGSFVKILLSAKNLYSLEKAVRLSKENGLVEDKDFFCILDNCSTELLPDNKQNTCFIAIGFRPMDEERVRPIMKHFELYR